MIQQFLGLPHHGFELYKSVLGKALIAKADVLCNGQFIHHFKLLIYLGNAEVLSDHRVVLPNLLAADQDRSSVFRINACEHFHQCAFSGAVFADKCHRFTGPYCKINVFQRFDRAE